MFIVLAFAGYNPNAYSFSIGLDEKQYPVTEGWTAELDDPDNGTVELNNGGDGFSPILRLEFKDFTKNTNIILRDPDGNAWPLPIEITKDGNSLNISY